MTLHHPNSNMKGNAMKMVTRIAPAIAASVTAVLLLAGCSGSGTAAPSSSATKPPVAGALTLGYWGSSTRVAKYDQIDKAFEAKYPGTEVQSSATDFLSYFNKLPVQVASRTMPCVTTMQTRQLNDYTTSGVLTDLQPLIDSGQIDVSDIPKNLLDYGRGADGKLYMIPFGIAWNAITVNQSMLKQYDIPALTEGFTWDDYGKWLKDAASKLPKGVAATDNQSEDESTFAAYVLSHGYSLFNKKGKTAFPKSVLTDYWNMWAKYQKAGYTTTPQQNAEEPAQLEQFYVTQGKALSEQTAGNALPGIQAANPSANMAAVAFASGKAGLGNMFFVSGYSIPKSCSNTAAAAAYVDFFTNNDASAAIFASDNGAVANAKQLKQQIANPVSPGVKSVLQQYQYILSKKVAAPVIPKGYNAVFETAFRRYSEDIQFGRTTVSQAVDGFLKEANAGMGN
jgi:multiple sugar transport system substrate-binding protein